MARTVQPRPSNFPKRKYPLTYVGNQLYIARMAEMDRNSYAVIPVLADRPADFLSKSPYLPHHLLGDAAGIYLAPSPISKEGILPPPPPPPNKPRTRSRSKISSQDALEDKLARISLTPYKSSKKGILPPAPNKPCTRSRSKIPGSAK